MLFELKNSDAHVDALLHYDDFLESRSIRAQVN
jgi:hypothetical protein